MKRLAVGITLLAVTMVLAPALVLAQGLQPVGAFGGTWGGGLIAGIRVIINIFLTLAGLIAVIFIIYGGVRYILARGEESDVTIAKNTILYAVIGLIVIGLSAAIVNFTIGAIWGTAAG